MWSEGETTLGVMRRAVASFVERRDWWRYHSPVNLASAAAVEAGELVELFQWRRPRDRPPAEVRKAAGGELADTLHYVLSLLTALGTAYPGDDDTLVEARSRTAVEEPSPKAWAEKVLVDASLLLMVARTAFGAGDEVREGPTEGEVETVAHAAESLLETLASAAAALDLDLARELEVKLALNEKRFPVGTVPDVGY
jgi:NTP pyrophosphatase (non-canonical NTP hydrolase)